MGVVFNGAVRDIFRGQSVPQIYDICKTADMLVETDCSFSRFGDGEFKLMTESGVDHNFQRSNPKLTKRLEEIIASNEEEVEIGVNRIYFYCDGFDHPHISDFIYGKGYGRLMLRYGYLDYLSKRDHYYDSVFSIPAHHYVLGKDFFDSYFERVKDIWRKRNVVLVTGDTEIMDYDFNIFSESARSVKLVELSKVDAFEYHGRIMKYISSLGLSKKNDILLLVCGLEATVLAYDLAECGYRAIDVGHIAKEYYNYKHGIVPYSRRDRHFF
jgi:hypothetical protein